MSILSGHHQAENADAHGRRFIESEADLDAMLKQFLPLTQNPALYYPELISSGVISVLTNLLSHENTDIAIDVVEVLQELTDEDIGQDEDGLDGDDDLADNAAGGSTATRLALAQVVDELVSTSVTVHLS